MKTWNYEYLDSSVDPRTDGMESNSLSSATLSDAERQRILYDWNNTDADFPMICAHQLFEQQVERNPGAIAVDFNGRQMSYGELNQRANQIARYLQRLGVGPEHLVGVCLQRSPEMVAGLLGVWKAGGAYVPLDPYYPQERLAFIVRDAEMRVLLTEKQCKHLFSSAESKIICLDSDWLAIAREDQSNPDSGANPSNLAYVMYTSGSTGTPKGAMIVHSGLVNYLTWAIKTYRVEAAGSVPVHSSISFDLTVTSLYTPLLAGGRVQLLTEDSAAQSLLTALQTSKGCSLVKITPAHLELLNQRLSSEEVAGMTDAFIIGGENLFAEKLRLWREFAPSTRLINEYGPTETVVGCCVYEVQPDDPGTGTVPIGRPIANTRLYVLDSDLQPVPVGETGELYIGGAGVARGYWNRPELTEERFLLDPFSGQPGARMYKSGDLARYREDGILECLGRVDNQVKVRGYRIELGEIEATLASHPDVQSCAVLAREDEPGNRQLVAYVCPVNGVSPGQDELHGFLKQRMPEYMLPAHLVFLESLPLTPNGKVDRKALPAPSRQSIAATAPFVAPRTKTEKALAAVWTELLKVENVGVNDGFFDLGGHSLLAFKATSRIRDILEVELPAQALFEHSTIAELAKFLKGTEDSSTSIQRIERRNYDDALPLSSSQEQLWFLNQLAPDSPVYNIVDLIHLGPTYVPDALQKAVKEMVRRHEILRTSFSYSSGQPMQFVSPTVDVALAEIDLASLPEIEQEQEWARLVREEGQKPFDLSQAPLFRGIVIHRSAKEHELLLIVHHIIADEWGMGIIHNETTQLYKEFIRGQSSSLVELPIQYADFACWQRGWLKGEVLENQLAYWKEELAGAPTVLELATDKPRPAVQSFRGATELFLLHGNMLEQLKALGRQEQATLFMILLAGFVGLLHRYTGKDDVLVGTPISGRTHSETENLIGCFLNTVILRAQFREDLTFRSLLHQMRERALGAYAHADLPFNYLVAELAPERDLSRTPLFQAMFILNDPDGVTELSKASGMHQLGNGTSKFDLTLFISETETGLEGLFEYSTDLFEASTIRQISTHFGVLLEAIASNPDQSVSKLPLLTEAERQQLLTALNDTAVEYPGIDLCLHQLIEQQAARTPDRTALVFGQESLSYAELSRRTNQLARHLTRLGVGPDVLVGLHVERSLDMVVGVLGILKAGGAYVPLDPSFPQNRLAYMVEDSQMKVLLTHRGIEQRLNVLPSVVVHLDSEWSTIAEENANGAELPAISRQNLAYVLYTSGSTGKPKGVEIPHCAIVNFLLSMQRKPGLDASDTLLAVTTLSFDIAGLELFLPLICGAKVVIASREDAQDPGRLGKLMRDSACTVMQATPATWRALIHAGWSGDPNLRILCGGEVLLPDLAQDLLSRCKELWNMYGPTETTVWSTIHKVTSVEGPLPIGKPIANTQVYVLDALRNLVPGGNVGELYIGGDGLARGYWHRDSLTRERFVPSPFDPNARLYRTGDLARWLPNGTLECLGRVDNQVKIRGFRIELGEVEKVLSSHPMIRQCAVIAREDVPGDKQLVAYFEKESEMEPTAAELRAYMAKDLPSFMVPSAFVILQRLPLTPNGKLDRKSLPAPSHSSRTENDFLVPRDAIEQLLARIWTKVLKVKRVGLRDNFFELGGHSLLAVRVTVEIEKLTKIRLPLATLLQAPTIADLAEILRKKQWAPSWSSLVPLRASGSRPPLFLMHAHGGNVLEYRTLADLLDPDQPVYALQARGLDGNIPQDVTLEKMASDYIEEMRTLQPEGPYFLAGFCFGGLLAMEAAQQLKEAGQEVAIVIMIQSMHPDAFRFKPEIPALRRWWYQIAKRIEVERENRSHSSNGYLLERCRYAFDLARTRVSIAFDKASGRRPPSPSALPKLYIYESLKVEYGKALKKYVPRPYDGDVVLIRAAKQLRGLVADEFLGWKPFFNGHFEVCEVAGHQENLMLQPNVKQLEGAIADRLKAAQQRYENDNLDPSS